MAKAKAKAVGKVDEWNSCANGLAQLEELQELVKGIKKHKATTGNLLAARRSLNEAYEQLETAHIYEQSLEEYPKQRGR